MYMSAPSTSHAEQTARAVVTFDPTEGLSGDARSQQIVDLIGAPAHDATVERFVRCLRRETKHHFDLYIEPLIGLHWPELRSTHFYAKFKIAAQQVYAPAPYTVLVLSRRRPALIKLMQWCARTLRLPAAYVVTGLSVLLPFFARVCLRRESRRIALMASFIAIADEAFDHHLDNVAAERRGPLLRGVLRGTTAPPSAPFALLRALLVELQRDTYGVEAQELDHAIRGCESWGDAEVKRFLGIPDPEQICHRGQGIRGGIDGLAWTVRNYISPREHQWMYNVSYFIQMLDDWVDLEKDLDEGVQTPVCSGRWNLATVLQCYRETADEVAAIAALNGADYAPFVALVRQGYSDQVRDLLQNMVRGIAA